MRKNYYKRYKSYFFMIIGCIFYALSLNLFIIPCGIVGGGISGAATLIGYLTKFNVGVLVFALNLPILILGLKNEGKKFIFDCLITTFFLGLFIDLTSKLPAITNNPILASLYGGIFQGIGIGIFLKYMVSSGGTELLGRIIHHYLKFFSIPFYIAVLDAMIVILGAILLKNPENVLYALIIISISAYVSNLLIVGINSAKLCFIITEQPDKLSDELIKKSPRGITFLNGVGKYSNTPKGVLMTCIKNFQLEQLKDIVKKIDENAFVIVGNANEVFGKGFEKNKS